MSGNEQHRLADAERESRDEVIAYTYNERDQLVGEDSTLNQNDVAYDYDANGS